MKPKSNTHLAGNPSTSQRTQHAKLALGIQVAGVALADIDYTTGLFHLSAEASELFGLGSVAQTFPKSIVHGTFHPGDLDAMLPRIAASKDPKGDGWFAMDHRIVCPNGAIRWLRVRKQVYFDGPADALQPVHAALAAIDVTDDHNAADAANALRATDQRLRLAAEITGVGVWEWNLESNLVLWDAQMFRIYGLPPTSDNLVPYATQRNAILPEDRPQQDLLLKDALLSLGRSSREFRIRRADDGTQRHIRSVERVQTDSQGKATSVIGTILDISESKTSAERIKQSEIRYRRLFEAAHDGVLLLDPATNKITDANPFMTSLLGYSKDQLVGKELFEIGFLKDETFSRTAFAKLKTDHEIRYENLPLRNSHGHHQEVEVVANLYDEGGHNIIQCNIRDITARKQAETILLRSKTLFTSLINQAPVGVYVVDSQFRLQQINPMAVPNFAGIKPLIGRDFAEIVHLIWPKKAASDIIKRFRHTLATGQPYQAPDISAKRKDTGIKKVYEWSIQRVELPDTDFGVVCFFSDITERTQESEAILHLAVANALNDKLKRTLVQQQITANALASSQLLTNQLLKESRLMRQAQQNLTRRLITAQEDERKRVSRDLHDVIAQSLTGINLSLASLLNQPNATPPDLRKKLKSTQSLIEQSIDTVHRFARDLRPAMLDDLGIIPSLMTYTQEFSKHNHITVSVTADPAVEKLNSSSRTVLYRIAQEALNNIAHHAHATLADIRLSLMDSKVHMEIQDNGSGFTVSGFTCAEKPTRLGLLGMKERVEMVGGQFDIDSAPGRPTTIHVTLPSQPTKRSRAKNPPCYDYDHCSHRR